jgi:hypothetical protein
VVSFGNSVPGDHIIREGLPRRRYYGPSGPELTVDITSQVVRCEGIETNGVIQYTQGRAADVLIRLDLDRPPEDLGPVQKALAVAVGLKVSTQGKKKGDGATWAGGRDDFLDDLWTTLEKLTAATGRRYDHDPVSRQFLSKMREHPSDKTVRKWLKKVGLRPQDIKAGRVTRANYVEFVSK